MKINIPEILVHLRGEVVERGDAPLSERAAMKTAAFALEKPGRFSAAQALARAAQIPFESNGMIRHLPGQLGAWTAVRDLPAIPKQSFRQWWRARTRKNFA